MEFRTQDVAKLVLGYLKQEKCQAAFENFLNTSPLLKNYALNYSRGKYIVTRIAGLSLVDYLTEYAAVYTIVQGRLEASEFYNEKRPRTTLVQQLLYLLDKEIGCDSRTSTPIHNECRCHQRNAYDVDHSSFETASIDTNTTPLESLPGHVNRPFQINKSFTRVNKSTNTEDEYDSSRNQDKCDISEEIFTQTFLENVELHEKLAENINLALSSSSEEKNSNMVIQKELDVAIKTIVQRTEKDPIFQKLITEIIGPQDEQDKTDTCNFVVTPTETEKLPKEMSTPKKGIDIDSISQKLLSAKKCTSPVTIEEQNNEAIQSIIAASSSVDKQPHLEDIITVNTDNTFNNSEVNELTTNTVLQNASFVNSNMQNQMYVNTGGLLMLQPSSTSQYQNVLPPKNLQVTASKSYYYVNGQPQVNNPQSTPLKVNATYTEQEILTMPTILLCDTNQASNPQTVFIPSTVPTSLSSQIGFKNIAPRVTADKAQTAAEYLTLYNCNDGTNSPLKSTQSQPPVLLTKSAKNSGLSSATTNPKKKERKTKKATVKEKQASVSETSQILPAPSITITPETPTADNGNAKINIETECIMSKGNDENKQEPVLLTSLPTLSTPKAKIPEVQEKKSRSTPRNSHVRQLNFSTPDKLVRVSPKTSTLFKVDSAKDNQNESNKAATSNLPVIPEEDTNITNKVTTESDKFKETLDSTKSIKRSETSIKQTPKSTKLIVQSGCWDSDLRALAAGPPEPPAQPKSRKLKRKRNESPKEVANSKKHKEIHASLNKTEDDAKAIEMALEENFESETSFNSNTKKANKTCNKKNQSKVLPKNVNVQSTENTHTTEEISQNVSEKVAEEKIDWEQNTHENYGTILNRNVKGKLKKKCNLNSSFSNRNTSSGEIVLTNIIKIKSCEILDESHSKLILSPSKLNANKRNLVEQESQTPNNQNSSSKNIEESDDQETIVSTKDLTPESVTCIRGSSSACRNVIPLLETPIKFDPMALPKTPAIFTSPTIDTPFTKAVIDQLSGVDISALPTPKFPITPNFPFTPAILNEQSPFSNRGTDYSTSSSYYQPSDTEQNKSLEQLLEECKESEKRSDGTVESKLGLADNKKGNEFKNKTHEKSQVSSVKEDTEHPPEIKENIDNVQQEAQANTSMSEKIKAFNESLIGRKNLQLVRMISKENEGNDCSDSSSTESDSASDSCSNSSSHSCDKTVKNSSNDAVSDRYSFRPRKSLTSNAEQKKSPEKVQETEPSTSENSNKKPQTYQEKVFQEMEEKRQRTIAKFKRSNANTSTKDAANKKTLKKNATKKVSKSAGKENTKTKTVTGTTKNKVCSTGKKKIVKKVQKSPMRKRQKTTEKISPVQGITTKEGKATVYSDKQVMLHLSSDDENLEPLEMVETELLENVVSDTPIIEDIEDNNSNRTTIHLDQQSLKSLHASLNINRESTSKCKEKEEPVDQEAECLVKGLKQWGIHLIPNRKSKTSKTERTPAYVADANNSKVRDKLTADKNAMKTDANETCTNKNEECLKEKLNISIEEGEIVSDTEILEVKSKTSQQSYKVPSKSKSRAQKQSESKKERITTDQNRHKDAKRKLPSDKRSKDYKKQITKTTKITSTEKIKKVSNNCLSKDKTECNDDKEIVTEGETPNVLNYHVQFEVKSYDKETISIRHDYSKRSNRSLKDYNLDILSKTLSANVYISEIDAEVKKVMTVTPFHTLLNIPSKITNATITSAKDKPNAPTSDGKKKSSLNILYNQIIRPATVIQNYSPLENLYSPESVSHRQRNLLSDSKSKSNEERKGNRKIESEQIVKAKSTSEVPSKDNLKNPNKSNKHSGSKQNVKDTETKEKISDESKTGISTNNIATKSKPSEVKKSPSNLKVIDGVVMLNSLPSGSQDDINDELMNYALVGSERSENGDHSPVSDSKKRKLVENKDDENQGKKPKAEGCQELLRNIDVDSFLKKLHGDT